jgi:uncharacterized membrane protein
MDEARGSPYPAVIMRTVWIAAISAVLAVLAGCVPAADERPLTPAEKEQFVQDYTEGQRLREEHGGAGPHMQCTTATGVVRMQAREKRYGTAEGFDTRSCSSAPSGN